MMWISSAMAQTVTTAPAAAAAPSFLASLGGLAPLLVMFLLLYVLMIRPQIKRQKELKAMIDALSVGDEVVLTGGILGKVTRLDETRVTLEVASQVQIQAQRGAVMQLLPKGSL